MDDELKKVRERFSAVSWTLGYFEITAVSNATGILRRALTQESRELASQSSLNERGHGWRRPSGGDRKSVTTKDTTGFRIGGLERANGGGSNGSLVRWCKTELQVLTSKLNLNIRACHLPPGSST